jgi:GT2 family glycosyltransferase/SAM-dependent methyltransferase
VPGPPAEEAAAVLGLPEVEAPLVSIVVPVFNQLEHTLRCLRALRAHTEGAAYEVIVVDDGSTDDTIRLPERLHNVRVLRHEENRGFVEACNLGAREARGGYLVFLNNDTEVRPGWLAALLDAVRSHPRVGAVGAKLLDPAGRLQEAGSVVWSDGSAWNIGRGEDPEAPEYDYVREVDYCSAACLLVPRELFRELGMFDPRYAPGYYEDVDLCFAIRRAGLRVLYQPRAEVTHAEGATSGRDPERGAKRFQALHQASFVEKWQRELAAQPAPGTDVRVARVRGNGRRVLVVDARTPMPDNDAGSLRMFRLMRVLTSMGCHVTFSPEIPVHGGRYGTALQAAGIEVIHAPAPSTATLEQHLERNGALYDTVILSRFYVARNWTEKVRRHCPRARVIVDTVDLHFLRERREAGVSGARDREAALLHIRNEEIAAARAADLTLVVSDAEKEILLAEASDLAVEVLPTIHDVEATGPPFHEREGILFVGSFQHPPNGDAIEYYAREIEPRIQRELPGLVLSVIGGDVPESVRALASDTIRFVGRVPDLGPWFRAGRLSVAPLRFGAGVKGKINTSMSFGVPVVTTSIGAEGLSARDGSELLVADDAESFARAVVRLYTDPVQWATLARNSIAAVDRRFSFRVAEDALRRILRLETAAAPPSGGAGERERRLGHEIDHYRDVEEVHDLPRIYHHWSRNFLLPELEACGIPGVDAFFLDRIAAACRSASGACIDVASIGAGNADLEVRLALRLREMGLGNFRFHCIELNPHMIERGRRLARSRGVDRHLRFEQADVAGWRPKGALAVCMANHSLHHIVELEELFEKVRAAIDPDGTFLVNDMIGRNGHMRWPEALEVVESIWKTLPERYKYNHQLRRLEVEFDDWDCARDSNEGVRAQDILPLLLERFHFEVFCSFANVIDTFIDRSFGPNFDPDLAEDRELVDRIARLDEELIDTGVVKPTHMIAALRSRPLGRTISYKHWTPEFSVRYPY